MDSLLILVGRSAGQRQKLYGCGEAPCRCGCCEHAGDWARAVTAGIKLAGRLEDAWSGDDLDDGFRQFTERFDGGEFGDEVTAEDRWSEAIDEVRQEFDQVVGPDVPGPSLN